MVNKILIANRGEIASRIIRSCKTMKITTVAIYSKADQTAPFVEQADESYLLGNSRVEESYLDIKKILSIANDAKVDAIHPGYGFLSENPEFAKNCRNEGFIFIGPTEEIIKKMGSKIEARETMRKAGVPIIPGNDGELTSVNQAIDTASDLGYPVMLKASAGGGGIGMQIVYNDYELSEAFVNNSKRAQSFFGDGTMFMEKKLTNARHIEVQVLGDHHGNVVHLFDRECSVQRRNQKIIEEAPSPFISKKTRYLMGDIAVQAAKAMAYTNAGTIEFLVDEEENFYFLEMNTRIQVEHAITEEITNLDIVKEQINIADGKALTVSQDEININGHAIEVRIYAEDPVTFYPSPGCITNLKVPSGNQVRNELSVKEGYNVTPFYDPMIGKLIVSNKTRNKVIDTLKTMLDSYKIDGIKTNIPMLKVMVEHEQFKLGNTTTTFVQDYYLSLIKK